MASTGPDIDEDLNTEGLLRGDPAPRSSSKKPGGKKTKIFPRQIPQ
jgi:hypothetical protein